MVTKVGHCSAFMHTDSIADQNVNWLELRKLRTTPGCDGRPHVLWHPIVLYSNRPLVGLQHGFRLEGHGERKKLNRCSEILIAAQETHETFNDQTSDTYTGMAYFLLGDSKYQN